MVMMFTTVHQQKAVEKLRDAWKQIARLPVEEWQQTYPQDAKSKDFIWIAKTTFEEPPDPGVRDAVYAAFEHLSTGGQRIPPPELVPAREVKVEWIGPRRKRGELQDQNIKRDSSGLEKEKYRKLCADCSSDRTILYLHGGAFYLGSAVASRAASTRLAVEAGARVVSMSYRLAPQEPFPAALVDAFTAYMSLLYPSNDKDRTWHDPISASKLVLAGDSAGANLCLALTQVLLHLQHTKRGQLMFRGIDRNVPLPCGLAFLSPWCDLTDSFPSFEQNARLDFLPYPQPPLTASFPSDNVWPTRPPRGHMYCESSTLDHPLVSPCSAPDWRGAPPMYMAVGAEERGRDSAAMLASMARSSGVDVVWEEYEGMPHCFALMLGKLPQATHCYESWGTACKTFFLTSSGEGCSTSTNGSLSNSEHSSSSSSSTRLVQMPDCCVKDMQSGNWAKQSLNWAGGTAEDVRKQMKQNAATNFPIWDGGKSKGKPKANI